MIVPLRQLVVHNTNGSSASDVCFKTGTSLADASCDISAKILSVRTGIGGTESEKLYVTRGGALVVTTNVYSGSSGGFQGGVYGHGVNVSSYSCKLWGGWGLTGASDVHCVIGASTTDASTPSTARLASFRTGITGTEIEKAAILADGSFIGTGGGVSTVSASAGWSIQRWYGTTTDATATEIFLNGVASSRATLSNSSSVMFKIMVVARDNTNHVSKAWEITGLIHRGAAAANTAIDSTSTVIYQIGSGADSWTVAPSADTTNGSLNLTVTGAAATTIRWSARLDRALVNF